MPDIRCNPRSFRHVYLAGPEDGVEGHHVGGSHGEFGRRTAAVVTAAVVTAAVHLTQLHALAVGRVPFIDNSG